MSGIGFTTLDAWPSSGVSTVRIWDIGVSWREIHLGKDIYDWSRLDAVVGQIQSIGAKIIYVFPPLPLLLVMKIVFSVRSACCEYV